MAGLGHEELSGPNEYPALPTGRLSRRSLGGGGWNPPAFALRASARQAGPNGRHVFTRTCLAKEPAILRIVAATAAFKGTLSPTRAAEIIARTLRPHRVVSIPVADGGDGTLECLQAAWGGRVFHRKVTGPLGRPVRARILRCAKDAVLELADASGLRLVPPRRRNPVRASTRGTGELIAAALDTGARRVFLGAGGSATVDGGQGALEALGGRDLSRVTILCDVTTRFLDAPAVFGPQKGATPAQVRQLRRRLERLPYARAVHRLTGSGAAGGLAGGLASRGATLIPGAPFILEAVRFRSRSLRADLIITGEGRVDATTFQGKAVGEVIRRSPAPVAVVCGQAVIGLDVPFIEMTRIDAAPMAHPARALRTAIRALLAKVGLGPRR